MLVKRAMLASEAYDLRTNCHLLKLKIGLRILTKVGNSFMPLPLSLSDQNGIRLHRISDQSRSFT